MSSSPCSTAAPPLLTGDRSFVLLQKWIRFACKHLHHAPGNPALAYYGTGESGWAMQTLQKALLAFAVVATDKESESSLTGASRDALLEKCLVMLRYSLATHRSGPSTCTDLAQWGNNWISVLGLERSFPVFRLLDPYLDENDRARIREVLLSEARWILECFPVEAGLVKNNHPEANLWNAAFLWKVGHLYPGSLDHTSLHRKTASLIRHGLSTPGSLAALDPTLLREDGPGLEANFFDSMALHHHGYLNVGYIVICLSQIALLHYDCIDLKIPEPPGWFHNARKAWELLRSLTFPDGRLARIGGDTRVRYCYCQDYNIPIWYLAAECWNDEAAPGFHHRWIETLELETGVNGDDSFLSTRCQELGKYSPIYYHRLESDRSVALALSRYWQRRGLSHPGNEEPEKSPSAERTRWTDAFHGAYMARTETALFSWVWRAAEPPQGLCVPLGRSDLAEWRTNLAGAVPGMGRRNFHEIESFHGTQWNGGFATAGITAHISDGWLAEGQRPARLARQFTACVVWGETMVLFQCCRALQRSEVQSIKGLHLNVPNDLFNNGTRLYTSGNQTYESRHTQRSPASIVFNSPSVTIDEALSLDVLAGNDSFILHRPPTRNIGLKLYAERDFQHNPGCLMSEELCLPFRPGPLRIEPGEVLYDFICRIRPGRNPAGETPIPLGSPLPPALRGVRLRREGEEIMLLFNTSDESVRLALEEEMLPCALSHVILSPAGEWVFSSAGLAVLAKKGVL